MSDRAQIFFPTLSGLRFDGSSLNGGLVYFYEPGTTISRDVFTNRTKSSTAANPYTLDTNGQAEVFLDGAYDIVVKTAGGATKATWEGYETIPSVTSSRGALVYGNGSTVAGTPVAFAYEDYDTDGIHEVVAHPERLTVPPGVTRVRLVFALQAWSTTTGVRQTKLLRNGGSVYRGQCTQYVQASATAAVINPMSSPVMAVAAGEFFTLVSSGDTVAADGTGYSNWFAMEIIE